MSHLSAPIAACTMNAQAYAAPVAGGQVAIARSGAVAFTEAAPPAPTPFVHTRWNPSSGIQGAAAGAAPPLTSFRQTTQASAGAAQRSAAAATSVTVPLAAVAAAQAQTQAAPASAAAPAVAAAPAAQRVLTPVKDYWGAHISQFRNSYNPNGPTMAPNCGPAAVTTALRLLGLDIPGFSGQRDQRVLDQARIIGTGKNDTSVGTTDTELERVITASGGKWSESTNLDQMLSWVRSGTPVILAGNPSGAWNRRFSSDKIYPFDGGHWVTVSGYDQKSGNYVVNDPLSAIGPILVPRAELGAYFSRNGGLGIGVYR